ncbi:MAG: hypothetical protein ACKOJF_04205 [Planctomycetaceae bacterium]
MVHDAYEALLSLGHSSVDARQKVEQVLAGNRKFKTVEEILEEIYRLQSR